jgi:hypothetical protein
MLCGWWSVRFPTHRKVRDGWGTRLVVVRWEDAKSKGRNNSNRRSPSGMTTRKAKETATETATADSSATQLNDKKSECGIAK